ncbi:MAG: UDP-N-acetylmuramoyl-L-alanine--D-glutamate ligase [Bacteroidota bacterium]
MENQKRLVVLGGGESGVGAALLAKAKAWEVFVSDRGQLKAAFKQELENAQIEFEEGQHSLDRIMNADLVVKSPGIPDKVALIQDLIAKGIPVISEIEFAARYYAGKIVAITGSNGKTTTTRLIHHLMTKAGVAAGLGGNIGESFARQLTGEHPNWFVLELSSFQLDGIQLFRPDIAVLLNITPDHLDRYEYQMANYVASKFRITMNQTADDWFIINDSNPEMRNWRSNNPLQAQLEKIPFPVLPENGRFETLGMTYSLSDLTISGKHNWFNTQVAVTAALKAGANPDRIPEALQSFENDPHRLELVGELDQVRYINDSKATNVDSVFFALDAMETPIVWIAGGTDKGNDYGPLMDLVTQKVHTLICLGVDNEKLKAAFSNTVDNIFETRSAAKAVDLAQQYAKPGDVALLSPACASFDLFKNYMDRGDQFKQAVLAKMNT